MSSNCSSPESGTTWYYSLPHDERLRQTCLNAVSQILCAFCVDATVSSVLQIGALLELSPCPLPWAQRDWTKQKKKKEQMGAGSQGKAEERCEMV